MRTQVDNPEVIALPPLLYGIAFAVVLVLRWLRPLPILAHAVALWLGLALLTFGVGIALWGKRAMQAAGTNVNPSLPTTVIVTSGPFRFSRNPLYVALTFMFLGLTLAVDTWLLDKAGFKVVSTETIKDISRSSSIPVEYIRAVRV